MILRHLDALEVIALHRVLTQKLNREQGINNGQHLEDLLASVRTGGKAHSTTATLALVIARVAISIIRGKVFTEANVAFAPVLISAYLEPNGFRLDVSDEGIDRLLDQLDENSAEEELATWIEEHMVFTGLLE